MINVFKTLVEKLDDLQEQMANVSREMETPRNYQKEMIEIKTL